MTKRVGFGGRTPSEDPIIFRKKLLAYPDYHENDFDSWNEWDNYVHVLVTPVYLIIGSNGMLGQTFKKFLDNMSFPTLCPSPNELDITDIKSVEKYFEKYFFDEVIDCGVYTNVDLAETERELCYQINVIGSRNLAIECEKKQVRLISFSTDYVYNENIGIPFTENEAGNAINFYGQTKYDGEKEIEKHCSDYLILRVSWLYSKTYGENFYKTMTTLGAQKSEISVVADQFGCPTSCDEVVEITFKCPNGVYNFSGEKVISRAEFATRIMKESGLNCNIIPISTEQYPTPAKRNVFSVMDQSKLIIDRSK
jgi:dTDP-4-dehydrorhamnose reductase